MFRCLAVVRSRQFLDLASRFGCELVRSGVKWARSFPSPFMTEFLSLTQAEAYTGKSRSTLRRFVESITKSNDHPDRILITPKPDEVKQLRANKHPFSWRVSKSLLDRTFAKEDSEEGSHQSASTSKHADLNFDLLNKTIAMLQTELDEKNKQIAQFQERQRETNVLLQQTTEKLILLTDGKRSRENETMVYSSDVSDHTEHQANPVSQRADPVSQRSVESYKSVVKQDSEEGSQTNEKVSTDQNNIDINDKAKKRESIWAKLRKPIFQK